MILKKKTCKVSDMSYKLSKSKINDYLQCPRKFRYRYKTIIFSALGNSDTDT